MPLDTYANLKASADVTQGFRDIIEPVTSLPERGVELTALGGPATPHWHS